MCQGRKAKDRALRLRVGVLCQGPIGPQVMVLGTSPSTIQRRRAASQIQAVVRNFLKDRRDTRDYTATLPCGFRHLHVLGIVALGWRTVNPHSACDYAPPDLCRVEGCFGYKSQTLAFRLAATATSLHFLFGCSATILQARALSMCQGCDVPAATALSKE